jgi:CRISPR-associated protein Cas2
MDAIIIYDITDNGIRVRVARTLMDWGCIRIQKSAFWGNLTPDARENLRLRLEEMMEGYDGNIQFYPLCSKCFGMRENVGENYEVKEEDVVVI